MGVHVDIDIPCRSSGNKYLQSSLRTLRIEISEAFLIIKDVIIRQHTANQADKRHNPRKLMENPLKRR
jgi:hypothetical protein